MPTLLAAAGEPDVKEKLLNGMKVGDKTFKNHLDGYNFVPFFKGEVTRARATSCSTSPTMVTHRGALRRLEGDVQDHQGQPLHRQRGDDERSLGDQPAARPLGAYQEESMYWRWWGDKLWTLMPAVSDRGQFLRRSRNFRRARRAVR